MARLVLPALFTAASRLAAVPLRRPLWRVDTTERLLYLTFDDGPDATDTPRLLDLLARHDARATFFLVGAHARHHPGLVRAVAEGGHGIGQHTDTHCDPWRTRPEALHDELQQATETLEDITGAAVRWARPPYGRLTPGFAAWCRVHEQRVALWDTMPGDFLAGQTVEGLRRSLTRFIRPGAVVVLHEGGRATAVTPPLLARMLPQWHADGWRFDALPA